MGRRLKLGMIGGGQGAFIGAVHRLCARMDDKYEFVAGCLSSTPEKAAKSAEEIGLDPLRSYPDFKTMADKESKRVAEQLNGRLAMLGIVACIGAYLTTGQIIPGFV